MKRIQGPGNTPTQPPAPGGHGGPGGWEGTGAVVVGLLDAVEDRVPEVHVGVRHVDLRPDGVATGKCSGALIRGKIFSAQLDSIGLGFEPLDIIRINRVAVYYQSKALCNTRCAMGEIGTLCLGRDSKGIPLGLFQRYSNETLGSKTWTGVLYLSRVFSDPQ